MLQEISITNFAIIPELRLSFHEGMRVNPSLSML